MLQSQSDVNQNQACIEPEWHGDSKRRQNTVKSNNKLLLRKFW